MKRLFIAALLLAVCIPAHRAQAQEDPSFDCKLAHTHVERVLCSGGNSGMGWIDQTMASLYKSARIAPGADPEALQTSQRAWLAQRNKCAGTDIEVMNCLLTSYRQRFAQISAPYDTGHLTGTYAADPINGVMDTVLFPDHSLAVTASSSAGAPSYDSCAVTFQAPLQDRKLNYKPGADEDSTDQHCLFTLTASGTRMVLLAADCSAYCGNAASIDGTYTRLRP